MGACRGPQLRATWNRYRLRYEEPGRKSTDFFPDVGIQPVTDGGLFAAGLFVASTLALPTRKTPRGFLETISVSNWCKFSIRSARNQGYIADVKKLTRSLPYVVGELTVLRPAVLLVPKALWRHPILRAAMRGASPRTQFLPVPQFNPRVVNIRLRKYDRGVVTLLRRYAGMPIEEWMANVSGYRERNAWRYLAMLHKLTATRRMHGRSPRST